MPSTIDKAKLVPASENDTINPGSTYLACLNLQRKTDPDSYWIVVRAPKEWLPNGFFDTRPVQTRVFPFWIVGKGQRAWLPRTSLFYLDKSQRYIYTDREKRAKFCDLLDHVGGCANEAEVLKHFKHEILESTRQYNERRERIEETVALSRRSRSLSSFMDDYTGAVSHGPAKTDRSVGACPEAAQPASVGHIDRSSSKRSRREPSPTNTSPSREKSKELKSGSSRANRSPSQNRSTKRRRAAVTKVPSPSVENTKKIKIKTEEEERVFAFKNSTMNSTMIDPRVRIFVGHSNVEFFAAEAMLHEYSPVLFSLISTNEDGSKYIMHPRLYHVDPDDFVGALEFMSIREYSPVIVSMKQNADGGPLGLLGKWTTEEYAEALTRAGRIFLLAKAFQIKDLAGFVFHKVQQAQFKQYTNLALIEFGRLLFTRPQPGLTSGFMLEDIDRWTIAQLAENFMQIMATNIERHRYLQMVYVTSEAKIHACVLERAASAYRFYGQLPVFIEESE